MRGGSVFVALLSSASLMSVACASEPPPLAPVRASVLDVPRDDHTGEIAACPSGSHPVVDLCVADAPPIPKWEPHGNGDPCEGLRNCDPQAADDPDTDLERGAIVRTLADAELDLEACRTPRGPRGAGRVVITFEATGSATRSDVVGPPFAGTPTGACIAARYRKVKVPDFHRRPAITVTAEFMIP